MGLAYALCFLDRHREYHQGRSGLQSQRHHRPRPCLAPKNGIGTEIRLCLHRRRRGQPLELFHRV